MTLTTETVAGRPVELRQDEVEPVKIRVLPDGRMDSNNAAKYLNRSPKTLAMWRMQGIGPKWRKVNGRIEYTTEGCNDHLRGEAK